MTERVTGGCICGAVRFQVDGPEQFACYCHCHSCQHASGAPVVAWATYARHSFVVTRGTMCWRESSPGVTRGHCAACGSSITYQQARRADDIDIAVTCLDDPGAPELKAHIWTEDKHPAFQIGDDLPVFARTVT